MLGWHPLEWFWIGTMTTAYIIGNGESRRGYDLNHLKNVYGTNAIHRDLDVDVLVCCDKRMVQEALDADYKGQIYTRSDWCDGFASSGVKRLPGFHWPRTQKWAQEFHWGSGLHSVHLAIKHGHRHLVMIGHDFWDTNGKHNNIYKGTNNYWAEDHHAVDPSFWILQFGILFAEYSNLQFTFAQPDVDAWKKPTSWDQLPMVDFVNIEDVL